jgi:hypothetical protein
MLFHILLKKRDMILKKLGEEYKLYSHDSCIATTQESPHKRLSKKNCDEMFGVVDVEMLAVLTTKEETTFVGNEKMAKGFIKGFNKAMELNKDKLFTVEDMKAIFAFGHVVGMNNILAIQSQHSPQPLPKPDSDKLRDEVIQSLQQPKEIEVEIRCYIGNGNKESDSFKDPLVTNTGIPKLDENGCLILKIK